jgi:hypothetical protein
VHQLQTVNTYLDILPLETRHLHLLELAQKGHWLAFSAAQQGLRGLDGVEVGNELVARGSGCLGLDEEIFGGDRLYGEARVAYDCWCKFLL